MFFLLPAYLSCVLIRSGSPPLGVYRNNHYICRRIALETSEHSEKKDRTIDQMVQAARSGIISQQLAIKFEDRYNLL